MADPDPSQRPSLFNPQPAWEEANRFHPNKRNLLAGLLAGKGSPEAGIPSLPFPSPFHRSRLAQTVNSFLELLIEQQIEAVSFDLFDTLVSRLLEHPHDLFLVLDRKLTGRWRLERPYSDFRIAAEEAARKSSAREEVTLGEIYAELTRATGLEDEFIRELLNLEIETELKFIRPRTVGAELLRKARENLRRVYLISDMYFGREQIGRILDACNLGEFSGLYLSSERGKTKHFGSLFETFLREEQLEPGKVIHVGDNPYSDRDIPSGLGMHSLLVRREGAGRAIPTGARANRLPDSIFSALERLSRKDPRQNRDEFGPHYGGNPHILGYNTLGPLLLGFLSRIYRTVKSGDFSRLYFVSRDAYYFQAVYEQFRGYDPTLPPSTYLYSSRKLICRALLIDEEGIARAAEHDYFPCRLKDLLTGRFFFTEADCAALSEDLLKEHGFATLDDPVDKNTNHRQFLGLVLSQRKMIHRRAEIFAERYLSYLRETIQDNQGLLIDIGYSGSLQSFIHHRLGLELEGLYLTALDRIAELRPKGLKYQIYLRPGDPEHGRFFHHVQMIELLLSAAHSSVIDVEMDTSGRWVPIYDDRSHLSPVSADALDKIHAGALKAATDFLSLSAETLATGVWEAGQAMDRLFRYLDSPDYGDCLYWGNLSFEDSFAGRARQYAFTSSPGPEPVWREGAAALQAAIQISPPLRQRPTGREDTAYLYDPFPRRAQTDRLTLFAYLKAGEDEELKRLLTSLRYQIDPNWTLLLGLEEELREPFARWQETYQPGSGEIRPHFFSRREDSFFRFIKEIVAENNFNWGFFCLPGIKFKPEALAEAAVGLLENPDFEGFYCDELSADGSGRSETFFKPDWSPELLLSGPYPGPFWGGRKEVWNFHSGPPGSRRAWLYEQLLRMSEQSKRVLHLPRALYEYSSRTPDPDFSPVIQSSLERRNVRGTVCAPASPLGGEGDYYSVKFPDRGPEVAVIIPTRNQLAVLKRCVDSLRKTTYQNYRIYIVDNGSDDPETRQFLATCGHRLLQIDSPAQGFNYSHLNNQAARLVGADYLLFLNNDTEIINPRWLSQMVGWLQFPGVGAVGGRLLFSDGRVQHAGIVNRLLYRVLPFPAFRLLPGTQPGYNHLALRPRNCSALTAACLLTPRRIFLESGGFDEKNFGVAYNDCDYGFRLTGSGYRNVYSPEALLYHYEGATRGTGVGNDNPAEEAACIRKYGTWPDPYYNLNLSLEGTDFPLSSRHPYIYREKKTLRLLLFSHNLNFEGAPLVLFEVARGLKQRGHQPVILSPRPGPLEARYRQLDIPVGVMDEFAVRNTDKTELYGDELRKIAGEIERLAPDAVAGNTLLSWWGLAAAGLLGIPYLWIIHESEPPMFHPGLKVYGRPGRQQAEAVFLQAYQNVFAAEATRTLYESYNRNNNMTIIHYSFDPGPDRQAWDRSHREEARRQLGLPDDELCILTPGTVCARKSQLDVILMIAQLPEHLLAKSKFFIVGDRPSHYSKKLHQAVEKLPGGRGRGVEIIPETDQINRYYLAADILAFPSRMESFPRVIMEAMHTELAIVTTPVFGIREMVADEVSALFFPPGDIEIFADRMRRVMESEPLRRRLGQNAKISLEKLPTPEEMTDQYEQLFLEAWQSGSPRNSNTRSTDIMESLRERMTFDLRQRYRMTTEMIEAVRPQKPLLILDAGSREGFLQHYLPEDRVINLDLQAFPAQSFVAGDLANLPFGPEVFDIAVSLDVLEHIKPAQRSNFLDELARVSRSYLIVGAPFFDRQVVEAEKLANDFHLQATGKENEFLVEHRQLGLPKLEEVTSWCTVHNYRFLILPNNYLPFWLLMMGLSAYFSSLPRSGDLAAAVTDLYVQNFSRYDYQSPSYRKILLIAKSGKLDEAALSKRFAPPPFSELYQEKAWGFAERTLKELSLYQERGLIEAQEAIIDLQEEIRGLNDRNAQTQNKLNHRFQQLTAAREVERRLRAELQGIKNTLAYRLYQKTLGRLREAVRPRS